MIQVDEPLVLIKNRQLEEIMNIVTSTANKERLNMRSNKGRHNYEEILIYYYDRFTLILKKLNN